jgi:tellurite resistance protein
MLQPSIGGKKKLKIVIMLVDIEKPPKIVFGSGERGILVFVKDYSYNFNIKGYDEEGSHINEARALSIRIGVAVAMSDGDFDDKERKTLDIWIKKMIMPFNQEKQLELKKLYNNAKNKAEQEFANLGHDKKAWEVELNAICRELHDINEDVQKYEALELAHEVMVSDGVEHNEESKCIFSIARNLGINADEIELIRSSKIHKLSNVVN